VLVDTAGHVLAVLVLAADVSDRDGAALLLALYAARYPELVLIWGDSHYGGDLSTETEAAFGIVIAVVSNPPEQKGFVVQPHRWVVERTQPHYRARPRIDRRPAVCDHRPHRVAPPGRGRRAGAGGARFATRRRGRAMSGPVVRFVPPRPVRARGAVAGSTCR
jgi:hypothetical protein